jgi:transposase-like protein
MVAESFAAGASVSKVAQRHGVNANLLFTWRRGDARSAISAPNMSFDTGFSLKSLGTIFRRRRPR